MAELRYQMTEMLEEEHKHRALIEEASLQRIKELELEVNLFLTTYSLHLINIYLQSASKKISKPF